MQYGHGIEITDLSMITWQNKHLGFWYVFYIFWKKILNKYIYWDYTNSEQNVHSDSETAAWLSCTFIL